MLRSSLRLLKEEEHFIRLEIVEASDLMVADVVSSDPYVKVYNVEGKLLYKTSVVKKSLNPVWNEQFSTKVDVNSEWPEKFRFEIWDKDLMSKDDPMGQVNMNVYVTELAESKSIDKWIPVEGPPSKASGTLHIVVTRLWQRKQSQARTVQPHGFDDPIEAVLEFAEAADAASRAGKNEALLQIASYYDEPEFAVEHLDENFQILRLLPKRSKLESAVKKELEFEGADTVTVTFHFPSGTTQRYSCVKKNGKWFKPSPRKIT